MITGDTITDAQIRELDRKARANGYDADHTTASLCWVALYDLHTSEARESAKYKARVRCAEILNTLARLDEEDARLDRDRERIHEQLCTWQGRGRLGR